MQPHNRPTEREPTGRFHGVATLSLIAVAYAKVYCRQSRLVVGGQLVEGRGMPPFVLIIFRSEPGNK